MRAFVGTGIHEGDPRSRLELDAFRVVWGGTRTAIRLLAKLDHAFLGADRRSFKAGFFRELQQNHDLGCLTGMMRMMSETQAKRGTDLEAFAARHGDALMRHAYLLTGNAHRAEDLVQDTLVRIANVDLATIEHPLAYARRSLVNLFLNEQRRLPLAKAALRLGAPRAEAGVADAVIEREAVRQALQHLKPKQRAVIILRYYEDLNDADIADVLHCGPSTVRSLLARARARLRDQLSEDLLDEPGGA